MRCAACALTALGAAAGGVRGGAGFFERVGNRVWRGTPDSLRLGTLCFAPAICMAAATPSDGASQVLPSQLYGVGLGLKRHSDGILMVNK